MTAVKKLTVGLRTESKAFRVDSMWGTIVDAILEARGKEISATYYTEIAESSNNSLISMLNEKEGNALLITRQDISFTKSAYHKGHLDMDETFAEFNKVWSIIQKILNLKGIRRIGIVAEHRFEPSKNNNIALMGMLTKISDKNNPASFSLHFENRSPVKAGTVIDVIKDGFTNSIYDFYDSAVDTAVPEDGKINANLDYQRYFAPSLDVKIGEAMKDHFFAFKKELKIFDDELVKLGIKK